MSSVLDGRAPADTVTAMRRVRRPHQPSRHSTRRLARAAGRRASVFFEFAMVLPVFVFLLLFTIDMGSMMLINGAVSDATYSAARAGAQAGGLGYGPHGTLVPASQTVAHRTLHDGLDQVPFSQDMLSNIVVRNVSGLQCTPGENQNVVIEVDYTARMMTPGLSKMLNMVSGRDNENITGFNMRATGVARCEILR